MWRAIIVGQLKKITCTIMALTASFSEAPMNGYIRVLLSHPQRIEATAHLGNMRPCHTTQFLAPCVCLTILHNTIQQHIHQGCSRRFFLFSFQATSMRIMALQANAHSHPLQRSMSSRLSSKSLMRHLLSFMY